MNNRNEPFGSQMPVGRGSEAASVGVIGQLASLLRALGISQHGRVVALLSGAVIVVICMNTAGQVRLNVWHGAFYDALEQRNMGGLVRQLFIFAILVAGLLILVVAQTWLREMIQVRARQWLACDLLDQWLAPKRAYRLAFAGEIGDNPDQRIQEDARHLTELSVGLGVGLFQASLLLMSFIGLLWLLSAQVVFTLGDGRFAIPGYMVWCALAYALAGSWLTWRVGKPLIRLNAERYAREAEFRAAVVHTNESIEAVSLYGGEADERRTLGAAVEHVVLIMRQLASGLAQLTWVTSGYGWIAIVVPIVVAAPGYFGGTLSFGELMMVAAAFTQVQQALRWFVDNFSQIADWRATLLRVVTFRDTLLAVEGLGGDASRIRLLDHPAGNLAFEDFRIQLPDGWAALTEAHVEVSPGERLLIIGEARSGKSMLFRALAGLWQWGTGTIYLPRRESMMFMPQRPYWPLGTLRAALCYPAAQEAFSETAVRAAVDRLGLGHFNADLDEEKRWDKELSMEEQQRLAFVRVLLHAPRWVFIDGAAGALDEEHRRLALSIFERELAGTTIIGFARFHENERFYHRTVRLVRAQPAPQPPVN